MQCHNIHTKHVWRLIHSRRVNRRSSRQRQPYNARKVTVYQTSQLQASSCWCYCTASTLTVWPVLSAVEPSGVCSSNANQLLLYTYWTVKELSVSCCFHREHYVNSGMRHRSACRGHTTSHVVTVTVVFTGYPCTKPISSYIFDLTVKIFRPKYSSCKWIDFPHMHSLANWSTK